MDSVSCNHVEVFKTEKGTCPFLLINAFYVTCIAKNARKRKIRDCYCYKCQTKVCRIHACLSCVYFGCFTQGHIQEHAVEKDHQLAVDITFGTIYCFACEDYMYDPEFEAILRKQKEHSARCMGTDIYFPWEPTPDEIELLKNHKERKQITDGSYLGLRGLINVGQTCFVNCIVQALIHTPLLRDYFFSDKHSCMSAMCLVCEMSSLFQEFYSGKNEPYVPVQLLYIIWKCILARGDRFKIGEQQDAHEFYIEMLSLLHLHSTDTVEQSSENGQPCNCIIDQIFTGLLQSDVICMECQTKSTTVDPFLDISLDIGKSSHLMVNSGTTNSDTVDSAPASLQDCLIRYTQPEYLDESTKRKCEKCQSYKASSKQLTLKKLPVVATFHLKRLEYNQTKKNSTYISFPECLDMTPFMSYTHNKHPNNSEETRIDCLDSRDNKFCLFAVVQHVGEGKGGHYFAYIRHYKNQWFKCDDWAITKASVKEVLSSEGYLLFYHKQILEYELTDSTDSE